MNRTIKFRGKSLEDDTFFGEIFSAKGKWVYGGIAYSLSGTYIMQQDEYFWFPTKVDSKTIGQYTGLKDKKGVEIYENMEIDNKYIVLYNKCRYILKEISNGDIIDLWRYINENGGKVTKEYRKI